jgi:hypothetical protein
VAKGSRIPSGTTRAPGCGSFETEHCLPVSDDQTARAVGCYGNKEVITPTLGWILIIEYQTDPLPERETASQVIDMFNRFSLESAFSQ